MEKKKITEEMIEVLSHLRYDAETDAILADCNFSCCENKKQDAPLQEACPDSEAE